MSRSCPPSWATCATLLDHLGILVGLSSSRPGSAPYVAVTIRREMSASPSCRSDLFRSHGSVR